MKWYIGSLSNGQCTAHKHIEINTAILFFITLVDIRKSDINLLYGQSITFVGRFRHFVTQRVKKLNLKHKQNAITHYKLRFIFHCYNFIIVTGLIFVLSILIYLSLTPIFRGPLCRFIRISLHPRGNQSKNKTWDRGNIIVLSVISLLAISF
jgi:hypothetical protein